MATQFENGLTLSQLAERNAELVTEVEKLRAERDVSLNAERVWEKSMMEVCGEDSPASVASEIRSLRALRDTAMQALKSQVEQLADALDKAQDSGTIYQQSFFRQSLMYDVVAEAYEEAKQRITEDIEIKARLCRESNSLFDRLRAAEKRIAELESRIVTAVADVLAERQRQISAEGWTPEHDDEYQHCEMAVAAACYIMADDDPRADVPELWPWPSEWWKPTNIRRDLVKAGALILAEIERLDRADSGSKDRNQPGMVVAVHIAVGDFVKFRDQVYEVKETDFDDHDVTLWFVCGEALKCAAGCQIEVVLAPGGE